MKRTRRQLTPEEQTLALSFKLAVLLRHESRCAIHDDPDECEEPVQAAHIIPKQALRRRNLPADVVYDPRNGLAACYRAHRRSDAGLKRFPPDRFPDGFWQFADEVGLRWLVEKLYVNRRRAVA